MYNEHDSLTSRHKITIDWLTCHLKSMNQLNNYVGNNYKYNINFKIHNKNQTQTNSHSISNKTSSPHRYLTLP